MQMDRGLALTLTVAVGGLVALQAPINALLGRQIGSFQAATVSFLVGTIALVGICVLFAGGLATPKAVFSQPWYYLIGGLLGAAYVTTVLVTIKTLGAGGITAAIIAGQLSISVLVDYLGAFGLQQRPIDLKAIIGIALLAAGTYLIVSR